MQVISQAPYALGNVMFSCNNFALNCNNVLLLLLLRGGSAVARNCSNAKSYRCNSMMLFRSSLHRIILRKSKTRVESVSNGIKSDSPCNRLGFQRRTEAMRPFQVPPLRSVSAQQTSDRPSLLEEKKKRIIVTGKSLPQCGSSHNLIRYGTLLLGKDHEKSPPFPEMERRPV